MVAVLLWGGVEEGVGEGVDRFEVGVGLEGVGLDEVVGVGGGGGVLDCGGVDVVGFVFDGRGLV